MTTIVPEQRTALGRHRRDLEAILASAPAGAAVVVARTKARRRRPAPREPAPDPAVVPDCRHAAGLGQQM